MYKGSPGYRIRTDARAAMGHPLGRMILGTYALAFAVIAIIIGAICIMLGFGLDSGALLWIGIGWIIAAIIGGIFAKII